LQQRSAELKKILKISKDITSLEIKDTTSLGLIDFAAGKGSPEALLIKGRLYENGLGIKEDLLKAASNYLKAFRLGSFKAAESLLKISQKEGFFKILESEVKSNPEAMYVWSGLIALGLDYSLTENQAFELLTKAENKNHINSIIEIGLAYYTGSLVEKDSLKAIEYFEKAASLNSSEAKIRLAYISLLDKGHGGKKDDLMTLKKYSKEGSVLAEAALAYCYENGIGVKMSKARAAGLYRQAAQRGNEAAYNSLRNMYDFIRPEDEEFQIYL
jgi:TPR repeat protein